MRSSTPPSLFLRFFRWFCHPKLRDHIEGDMMEIYGERLRLKGKRTADFRFIIDVLLLFRPGIIRPSDQTISQADMLASHLKIGWRNMMRDRVYSFIKIGGFSVGIAGCLIIALYVSGEAGHDQFYANQKRVYRLIRETTFRGTAGVGVHFPAPMAAAMKEDFPEVELAGHYLDGTYFGAGSNEVRRIDQLESTHEEHLVYMNQDILSALEVKFVEGNPSRALTDPGTLVMTRSKAHHYFGDESAIGKVIILNNDETRQYQVSAVIEDFPATSHLPFDMIMTLAGKEFWSGEQSNWSNSNYIEYLRLRPGTDAKAFEGKLALLLKKYFLPFELKNGSSKEAISWINSMHFKLQPLNEIYLNDIKVNDGLHHGDIRYIWLFSTIAVFILLIACFNFINLSTAKSANRAKEVGLRKMSGSSRTGLVRQFLTESVLYSFCSLVLGLLLASMVLPSFNSALDLSLALPWQSAWFIPFVLSGVLIIGIIAGVYPAFYLSSYTPAQVLKGTIRMGARASGTRNALVVIQFTISIILIIGTVITGRQMDFVLHKNLGYDKDQVVLLHGTRTMADRVNTFRNEVLRLPGVAGASITDFVPVEGALRNGGPIWIEGMGDSDKPGSQQWTVDEGYLKTMGLRLIDGRNFSADIRSDSQATIINETAARELGLKKPVGSRIYTWKGPWTVIGVVEDFHWESMKQNIRPVVLQQGKGSDMMAIKLNTADIQQTLESLTSVWKTFSPQQTIRFTFLDEQYALMYADISRMQRIFTLFSVLAIILACLGLFALSTYMTEQRSKEIGVRVVLGASVRSIFVLLTQNFVKLVLLSFVIAAPAGWYFMTKWLEDYAYKTSITASVFVLAGIASLSIAVAAVSYQAIRAALVNPATSLRSE